MTYHVKVHANKSNDLSAFFGTHMVKGDKWLMSSDVYTYAIMYVWACTHTYNNKVQQVKNK